MVVSDWDAVKSLTTHGFAKNDEDAAVRAVNAGVDMEMSSFTFRDSLPQAVRNGLVSETTINAAVRDILVAKYKLGLFKNPYIDVAQAASEMVTPRAARHRSSHRHANRRPPARSEQPPSPRRPVQDHRPHRPSRRLQARHHGLMVPRRPSRRLRHRPRRHAQPLRILRAHPLHQGRRDRTRTTLHLRRPVLQPQAHPEDRRRT